jgi:hypothetical protein
MKHHNVVFYAIKGSTIKKLIIIDFITGTFIYYGLIIITSSILVGVVGSMVCTESMKRLTARCS